MEHSLEPGRKVGRLELLTRSFEFSVFCVSHSTIKLVIAPVGHVSRPAFQNTTNEGFTIWKASREFSALGITHSLDPWPGWRRVRDVAAEQPGMSCFVNNGNRDHSWRSTVRHDVCAVEDAQSQILDEIRWRVSGALNPDPTEIASDAAHSTRIVLCNEVQRRLYLLECPSPDLLVQHRCKLHFDAVQRAPSGYRKRDSPAQIPHTVPNTPPKE